MKKIWIAWGFGAVVSTGLNIIFTTYWGFLAYLPWLYYVLEELK